MRDSIRFPTLRNTVEDDSGVKTVMNKQTAQHSLRR